MLETPNTAYPKERAFDRPHLSKRCEARRRVIYRASIVSVVRAGDVHITGIAPKTVSGFTDFALAAQQRIVIDLGLAGPRFVTVTKCEGGRFAGQFENPWARLHPSLNWLVKLGRDQADEADYPRQSLVAGLSLTGGHSVVNVRNLSDAGAMIEADLPFVPGQFMLFSLTYGEPVLAEVRWTDKGRAGLQFHGPLPDGN